MVTKSFKLFNLYSYGPIGKPQTFSFDDDIITLLRKHYQILVTITDIKQYSSYQTQYIRVILFKFLLIS